VSSWTTGTIARDPTSVSTWNQPINTSYFVSGLVEVIFLWCICVWYIGHVLPSCKRYIYIYIYIYTHTSQ
jgi:cytochrome c biogenesis protein CcdA